MNLYLSISKDECGKYIMSLDNLDQLNILVSYEYRRVLENVKSTVFKNFIADSGAFTAMNAGRKIDKQYIDGYIDWILEKDIDHYIEMDLDEIVGYEKVLEIRKYIEGKVGKPSIPVRHLGRGEQGWKDMCDQYDYVAMSLSGFTDSSKWLMKHKFEPLKWFLHEANKRGARVHALGCNRIELMKKYHFYSCDSSCHTQGGRYGNIFVFEDGKLKSHRPNPKYKKDRFKLDKHNVDEMIKVMNYATHNM